MSAEGQLEAAAECEHVDRRNDGLRARFHRGEQIVQGWSLHALRRVELTDISSTREDASGAGQDDGCDTRIRGGAIERLHYGAPRAPAEAVHRRIIETDDGDSVLCVVTYHRAPTSLVRFIHTRQPRSSRERSGFKTAQEAPGPFPLRADPGAGGGRLRRRSMPRDH